MRADIYADRPAAPPPVVGYRRTNRGDGTEGRQDLDRQTAVLHAAAATLGATLAPSAVYEDFASGQTDLAARPGLQALVAYCQAHPQPAGQPGVVLVADDARLERFAGFAPQLALYLGLDRAGWLVRSGPGAAFGTGGLAVVWCCPRPAGHAGPVPSETHWQMWEHARAAAARGVWLPAAPYGYRLVRRPAPQRGATLALGPAAEVAEVRWLFETYAAGGITLPALAAEMRARGTRVRITAAGVRRLLTNPAYAGDVVWGRRPTPDVSDAPNADWAEPELVRVCDAHPAIVPRALYATVTSRLLSGKHPRHRRPPDSANDPVL